MKSTIKDIVSAALARLAAERGWPEGTGLDGFVVEEPRDPAFGQLATNAAMTLAKPLGLKPRELAGLIVGAVDDPDRLVDSMEIAGPGFINFRLASDWWAKVLASIRAAGDGWGRRPPNGRRIQVEFVSANPTGPLHVGHGRGAAVGDALARILAFAGHDVEREYYVNDAGRQMRILGLSALYRLELLRGGHPPEPADYYKGGYVSELAERLAPELDAEPGSEGFDSEAKIAVLSRLAGREILRGIEEDLADFRVRFDRWFTESSLYADGIVEATLGEMRALGRLYERDGALWFRSSDLGDDKDRVLIKNDGSTTYFCADIAYHRDKFRRGFDGLVDVWGADHHGYINRMRASVEALGKSRGRLRVVLVQLVNLLRDGRPVNMSTRSGEFVTLREVLDEVGADAARFIFLTRSHDSALDFDLELAKQKTRDNPVFYVQYACARISSLLEKAGATPEPDLSLLKAPEELETIKHLAGFPDAVQAAADRLEPHLVTVWLSALAKLFHQYYAVHRLVVDGDPALTAARVALAAATRRVAAIGLDLLGVTAPEKM